MEVKPNFSNLSSKGTNPSYVEKQLCSMRRGQGPVFFNKLNFDIRNAPSLYSF